MGLKDSVPYDLADIRPIHRHNIPRHALYRYAIDLFRDMRHAQKAQENMLSG